MGSGNAYRREANESTHPSPYPASSLLRKINMQGTVCITVREVYGISGAYDRQTAPEGNLGGFHLGMSKNQTLKARFRSGWDIFSAEGKSLYKYPRIKREQGELQGPSLGLRPG